MEQTLGKRIVANRKRLGLTQDSLAEQLGVTAQAVSKWENDQSCPDITMIPRLAEIFGITTDELLGVEKRIVQEAEMVETAAPETPEASAVEITGDGEFNWEFKLDNSRKGHIGMAVWVLAVGGLLLASRILDWDAVFWDILWPTGLLVFGLFGVLPKPSFFRIGCLIFGAYFLLCNLNLSPVVFDKGLLFAAFLLLFGTSLLVDALRNPRKGILHFFNGDKREHQSSYSEQGERFECATSFGEDNRVVSLPRLSYGQAKVNFGDLKLDLTGCESFAGNSRLELSCAFGEIDVYIPKCCRAEPAARTSFGDFDIVGSPDPDAAYTVYIDASISFGQITVKYL